MRSRTGRTARGTAAAAAAALTAALVVALAPAAPAAGAAAPDTVGLFDPLTGTWYLRDAAGGTVSFAFGEPGSVPVAGDWDGDGIDTVGVYDPASGLVGLDGGPTLVVAAGGVPVVADPDGDGRDTVQVIVAGDAARAVAADRDGDGRDEVMVEVDGAWWSDGAAVAFPTVGDADSVVVGDWDGDGRQTAAVYRARSAEFWLYRGDDVADGVTILPYGSSWMLPVAGRFGAPAGVAAAPLRMVEIPTAGWGDRGVGVVRLQATLAAKGFYRGAIDGEYGGMTAYAVMAFRKVMGLDREWTWDAAHTDLLATFALSGIPDRPDEPDRIEVDIERQVMVLFLGGEVDAIVPVSTGGGYTYFSKRVGANIRARTPQGDFALLRGSNGWSCDPLYGWCIYKPWNFTSAYAIHGYNTVPAYPASHGCVRIPNWEADALTPSFYKGMPVHVWDEFPVVPDPSKMWLAPPPE
ncbi:MAG: L,D-transpeptidase family protein [Actinobacteria bacterium]|nr:L,D-transpeptidase family protein [Actinomycetota bacterium]